MIYDILEQKLIDAGLGIAGQTLFRNTMPGDCKTGIFIREPLSGIPIDASMMKWYRARLQVITRHFDPVEGRALALAADQALRVQSIEIYPASAERGRAHITLFMPETLPIQFPRLDGGGYECSQHFTAAFGMEDL